jgi:hypothetical protein
MLTTADLIRRFSLSTDPQDLQVILDAAYHAIEQRIGPVGEPVSEFHTVHGPLIQLNREADIITDVVEFHPTFSAGTTVELDDSDYELRPSGQVLVRLRTGSHPAYFWRGRVDVTYLPKDDQALRDSVAAQLVELELNAKHGLSEETIGSWSERYNRAAGSYTDQRESILGSLGPDWILN